MIIHISIDDVDGSFFNRPQLYRFLKKLHIRYNAVFTVYIQNWADLDEKIKIDLSECAEWLKFGIHTTEKGEVFCGGDCFLEAINFIDKLKRIGVQEKSITRIHRLHMFAGTEECILSMKQALNGKFISGLLTADDSRQSYYLNTEICKELYSSSSIVYDVSNDILFIPTDIRLDWFDKDFRSNREYKKPCLKKPYKELESRYKMGEFERKQVLTIFTHYWQIYRRGHLTNRKKWIEDVCRFAKDNDILIGYLEGVITRGDAIEFYEN